MADKAVLCDYAGCHRECRLFQIGVSGEYEHEVCTPLNVIVGFSELLASASTGEEEILLLEIVQSYFYVKDTGTDIP